MSIVLKLKVRTFYGISPTFAEVTREKLIGVSFLHPPHALPAHSLHIVKNRVKLLKYKINIDKYSDKFKTSRF